MYDLLPGNSWQIFKPSLCQFWRWLWMVLGDMPVIWQNKSLPTQSRFTTWLVADVVLIARFIIFFLSMC